VFIDQGGNNFWGVEWFNGPGDRERLAAFSDRDFGLYILRYTGPGAATAPSCEDALARTRPNRPVTVPLTCRDPNTGNVVSRAIVSQPGNGTVALQGDRAVYTPRRGFRGEDRFTFRASDGSLVSNLATARILVGGARCGDLRLGTAASERLIGTEFGDTIVGYAGDDVISGRGGRDCISGMAGNDRLAGGKGGDTVDGQTGRDRITGGNARDTVRGGPGADRVSGGGRADLIQGDAGSDRLRGGSRRDLLRGGIGRDNIDGGRGRDSIEADSGADRISARDGARDSIDCGRGRDTVVTRDSVDELTSCEVRGRPGR
jgi:Ca2+-binding RTX toxin-like protein